jgi:putative methyltransferase (TIGR04325 family)
VEVDIVPRVVAVLKSQIVQNVGPIRRLSERIEYLECERKRVQDELARAQDETMRFKRMLNLIGDEHKLFASYTDALSECSTRDGYDSEFLSRYIVEKSRLFLDQLGRPEPICIPDHSAHTLLVALLVAQERDSLRVIDFGGACGIPVAILSRLLGISFTADWHVIELPSLVVKARERIAIPCVTFSDSLDRSVEQLGTVDLVHVAGTLQYVDDPRAWLARLLALKAAYLFIGRAAFTDGDHDVIGIQRSRVRDHGVQMKMAEEPDGYIEYPFFYMRRCDFDEIVAAAGYHLIASFESSSGYRPINDHRITGGAFLYCHHDKPPTWAPGSAAA